MREKSQMSLLIAQKKTNYSIDKTIPDRRIKRVTEGKNNIFTQNRSAITEKKKNLES